MVAGRVGSLSGRKGSGSRGVYHSSTISYSRRATDVSDELCTCGPFAVNEAEQRVPCKLRCGDVQPMEVARRRGVGTRLREQSSPGAEGDN